MIYESLFEQTGNKQIKAGLIGTGTYGISLLAQTQRISRLSIPVICDQDPQAARIACFHSGIPEDKITICSDRNQIHLTMERGCCAIAENYELMLEAPLDVIVESTGNPDLFEYRIIPASLIDKGNPIPFYMAAGNQVKVDVSAGDTITCDMIAEPEDSRLWELRRQQDRVFINE